MKNLLKRGILLLLGILALSVIACKKEADDDSVITAVKPVVTKTVTFMVDKKVYKTQTVELNKTVSQPETPKKNGFYFIGWFTSSDDGENLATTKYDFNTSVTQNLKLYANWSEFDRPLNANSAVEGIKNLTESRLVRIDGELSSELLKDIAAQIKEKSFELSLDLTETTGLERIEEKVFYRQPPECCTSLKTIILPAGVASIGNEAFHNCTILTMINIPDTATKILGFAFPGCTNLTTITIPESVTNIGNGAFCNCTSLTTINIPDRVTSINDETLKDCSNLTTITISSGVTKIGSKTFMNCTSLASITFLGTKSQWGGINKERSWKDGVPTTVVVHCSDGDVTL